IATAPIGMGLVIKLMTVAKKTANKCHVACFIPVGAGKHQIILPTSNGKNQDLLILCVILVNPSRRQVNQIRLGKIKIKYLTGECCFSWNE
ncbi:MAG: hypothetical protein RLZZ171_2352, partial [Cyanobacteriota bacterium]